MDSFFRERLANLESRFKKFLVVGHDNVRVAGSLRAGFVVNIDEGGNPEGGGSTPVPPIPPPPITCCDRDITEINSITVTLSIDASFHGSCGAGSRSDTFTWNFVRIGKDDTFDCLATFIRPFKLYLTPLVDGCCSLAFVDQNTNCSTGVYPHNWGKASDICAEGDFRFPAFHCVFDGACNTGTVRLAFDDACVVAARFGGDEFCSLAPCAFFNSSLFAVDLATDIPISSCDFSGLLGTYTASHLQSYPTEGVDITITVQLVFS